MSEVKFYYDESEHSRKISQSTIKADNYYDNFVTVIVGWNNSDEKEVEEKYNIFEEKYEARKSKGELKSDTLRLNQFRYGFYSLTKGNINLVNDFLNLFDEKIYIYFSVISKIEYIINQLFKNYKNTLLVDMDSMKYSIVKSIIKYHPEEIMSGIYEKTGELIKLLKSFYRNKIQENKANLNLKKLESKAFNDILTVLDGINDDFKIEWNYNIAFYGFTKYVNEKNINKFRLFIDKEGESRNTLRAAKNSGIQNAIELDSKLSFGIRMADMLAGTISKLLKALSSELKYKTKEENLNKNILSSNWFNLNEQKYNLYRQLCFIISSLNNAWYKSFSGVYSDDLILMVALLNYINQYDSLDKFKKHDAAIHSEYFNSYSCQYLFKDFEKKKSKLSIEPVSTKNKEFYYNQRGAKVFFDIRKQPLLKISSGDVCFDVLSVGFIKTNDSIPTITIMDNGTPKCFRLPEELNDWVYHCVSLANMGQNLFPTKVMFSKQNQKYYVDFVL